MCGICAAIGVEDEIKNVICGLKKLEYRGYDSSGVAAISNDEMVVIKSVGMIKNLEKKISDKFSNLKSNAVIGHTRWATHGKVCEKNAHPHTSANGEYAMVHNGIVENFEELKRELDCTFLSQTDTEVFVNLIERQAGDGLQKLIAASKLVKGSFAVALLHLGENKIFVGKRQSPLMVAQNEKCVMAASDISVFAGKFDHCYILEDDEFAILSQNEVQFFSSDAKQIEKEQTPLADFDFFEDNSSEKCFMLKEIKEQPMVLRLTYFKYFSGENEIDWQKLRNFKRFHFISCGTAYHSCLLGAKFVQSLCKKECQVSIASEFRYDDVIFSKSCLYVFVSQSGETADTIACAKLVKEKGCFCLCVTNVPYCSLNKLADFVLPTFAGREVAVASTKAYTAQVFTLLIFALKISGRDCQDMLKKFVLDFEVEHFDFLNEILPFKKIFFIGREKDYVTSLEASLKLKEIAYLNCVAIAAGELKHGTLALIDEQTLVIAICTQKSLKEKLENNILEVQARGGKVMLVSCFEHNIKVDYLLKLPMFDELLMPIVAITPLQMLAFSYATKLGFDPDKPRNLAKSVTVE